MCVCVCISSPRERLADVEISQHPADLSRLDGSLSLSLRSSLFSALDSAGESRGIVVDRVARSERGVRRIEETETARDRSKEDRAVEQGWARGGGRREEEEVVEDEEEEEEEGEC